MSADRTTLSSVWGRREGYGQMNDDALHWPAAFSETFLAGARQLFADTHHVMIVGPLGSHRGTLAGAIAGSAVATSWGRNALSFGPGDQQYAALNHLLPSLRAAPGQPVEDVVAATAKVLDKSFGLQTICLHEADLCDEGSLDVLAHLVESRRIALVCTVGASTGAARRLARSAALIDLPPLDDEAISRLLEQRFGAVPHPTTVAILAHRSQGAYAVLKQLADAGYRTGQITPIAGVLVTDISVPVDAVDEAAEFAGVVWPPRFASDHPARDVIDAAALTLDLDLEEAIAVFGESAVQAAVDGGAVRVDADRVVFASRVEAILIRNSLTDERRTTLYRRYADRLHRTAALPGVAPRVASWFRSIDQPLTVELAVQAATRANHECRYLEALQFVDTITPAERSSRLLVEQAHALSESGADDQIVALLRSTDFSALHEDDLLPFLRWSGRYLDAEEIEASLQPIRDHLAPGEEPQTSIIELARLFGAVYADGSEDHRRQLRTMILSDRLSTVNRAMAHVALANSLRHVSRVEQAVTSSDEGLRLLVELGDTVSACNIELAMETQIVCRISAADYAAAHDALTAYSTPGVAYGNLGRLGTALWGIHAFFSGDLASALAHAQLALARTPISDPHQIRGWIESMSAQILAQVGDIDRVHDLLEASSSRPANTRRQHDLECRLTRACVHDAIGEPEEALTILEGVIDEARAHDLLLEEVDAAVLSVQIGGPIHLDALLRAVEHVDDSCGTSHIWQRFAWAVRDNDMRSLVALAEELDLDRRPVFAAEVAQFTLDIARRAADMSPQQRQRLVAIADPMQHRHVSRSS